MTRKNESVLTYPLLPLRDIIVFPHMVVPLFVGREKSIRALEEAMAGKKQIVLAAQKKAQNNNPDEKDIFAVGTIANIIQLLRLPDGTLKVLVEGLQRVHINSFVEQEHIFRIEGTPIEEFCSSQVEVEALMRGVKGVFETYVKFNKKIPPELMMSVLAIDDGAKLSDTIIPHLNVKVEEKQKILEMADACQRLERLYSLIDGEIEILQVEKKIRSRVKKQMERSQKEYYLNEQMQAIQKELGERDEFKNEVFELEKAIKRKNMPEEVAKKARAELKKIKMMSPMSAEATVVRNYLDWLISLPWNERSDEKIDIKKAENILDEDHYGLKMVKERILEQLSVQCLVEKIQGPILCLVGPPGVGKTSLARSIARSINRRFVKISLGGVRDEAEIRGHRRTYIGAMPGKLIQSMKKAETVNPVVLLDEIDKMSADFRGDPSSALLEVLDPEQNKYFSDHYLEVEYDLSNVMFITTANSYHSIPWPLLDRLEVISLSGYTEEEKMQIATQHLIPKQMSKHGLKEDMIQVTPSAVESLIRFYTREAGVRNLERELASICRKMAHQWVKKSSKKRKAVITPKALLKVLGPHKYRHQKTEENSEIGLCNGLAFTETGGDMLTIEVAQMPGKGKLTVTGKLGDVMQESAQAAMSYVRSRAKLLGLTNDFYQKIDLHIHVPEGAIPKDGPSAGITMATALVSALTAKPVSKDVAMTGEITLRGNVLPIGGLKEKIFAAHRGGVKKIIIPRENVKDLKDVPKNILKSLTIIDVTHMDQVLMNAILTDEVFKGPTTGATIEPPLPTTEHKAPPINASPGKMV
ncbi:MAG: endopeptidase La [Deltaproteobacteria bacterium]|nr:endopeptidase La [Deltaproteobacteria bacterium]MBI3294122.1 endopeptidase La [Deltaproteobacteria bacterium]